MKIGSWLEHKDSYSAPMEVEGCNVNMTLIRQWRSSWERDIMNVHRGKN